MGMTPDQHLRPEAVYRLNSELEDIRRSLSEDFRNQAKLQPTVFNTTRRCFHWLSVREDRWNPLDTRDDILNLLRAHKDALEKQLAKDRAETERGDPEAKKRFQALDTLLGLSTTAGTGGPVDPAAAHHAALTLLTSWPLPHGLFLDGIVVRAIQAGAVARFFEGELLWEKSSHDYPPVRLLDESATPLGTFSQVSEDGWVGSGDLAEEPEAFAGRTPTWLNALLHMFMKLERTFRPNYTFVVPIHEIPASESYQGALLGNVHVLFGEKPPDLEAVRREIREQLAGKVSGLARALRTASLARISSRKVSGDDLVTHFARTVAELQDWERLLVSTSDGKRTACWCRRKAPASPTDGEWHLCGPDCRVCETATSYAPRCIEMPEGKDLRAFVDPSGELLPELSRQLSGVRLTFQYPEHRPLPSPGDADRLAQHYWREQHDIWQLIVPKIRASEAAQEARRQARRSGVVAIMARNMSHNIGSHVLARLSTPVDLSGQSSSREAVAWLNSYLRTRMDFIADVATATPTVQVPMRLFEDVLWHLISNDPDEKFERQLLLLNHISGHKDIGGGQLDIKSGSPNNEDTVVAMANGVLGAHALYVIVENIIRNSAKHAFSGSSAATLELAVRADERQEENIVEVTLSDNCGNGDLAEEMNLRIRRPILAIEGVESRLDDEAWGMKEMKTCAAYLRGIRLEEIDEPAYAPGSGRPLLEAVAMSGNLGYKVYLPLPSHALVVVPGENDSKSRGLAGNGWDRLFPGVALRSGEFAENEQAPHDFLVMGPVQPGFTKGRTHAPLRSLALVADADAEGVPGEVPLKELRMLLRGENYGECFTDNLWEAWRGHAFGGQKLVLRIDLPSSGVMDRWLELDVPWLEAYKDEEPFTSDEHTVLLDWHGAKFSEKLVTLENADHSGVGRLQGAHSYDPMRGTDLVRTLAETPPANLVGRRRLAMELLEAGSCGVIILDERIQMLACQPERTVGNGLMSFYQALRCCRVFMPPCPGKNSTPDDGSWGVDLYDPLPWKEHLRKWLDLFSVESGSERAHFLVAHLGVLEKLLVKGHAGLERERHAEADSIQRLIDNWEDTLNLQVVLTSGRGSPPIVRRLGTRFVHYSNVARHVIESRSKLNLCRVLFASRRIAS